MASNGLAMQGERALTTVVLTQFSQNFLVPASEGSAFEYKSLKYKKMNLDITVRPNFTAHDDIRSSGGISLYVRKNKNLLMSSKELSLLLKPC